MASNSGFDITVPSNTSSAALGDDEFRSVKSFMKEWFEQEHYATDGRSNSAGVHKLGSGRAFQQAGAPTAVNPGQMWHDTDDDTFYVAEAAGTGDWTAISSSIAVSSVNTWTALQNFSSNITVSDLGVTSAIGSIIHASLTTDLATINAGASKVFNITATGAIQGAPVVIGYTKIVSGFMIVTGFVTATDTVQVIVNNPGVTNINPANTVFTATVFNTP